MAKLFSPGSGTQAAQPQSPAAGLRVQTSVLGKCWPLVYGTTRIAPNLIWYGDFVATPTSSPSQGGKGIFSPQTSTSSGFDYSASFALGLCEGPIPGIGNVYVDQTVENLAYYGFTAFLGTFPQTPWTYLETNHSAIDEVRTIPAAPGPYTIAVAFHGAPFSDHGVVDDAGNVFTAVGGAPAPKQYAVDTATGIYIFNAADAGTELTITYQAGDQQPPNEAIGYNGFAYVAAQHYALGSSASLPNHGLEVFGFGSNSVAGQIDCDPSFLVTDLLTEPHHGAEFPADKLGDLTQFQNYTLAAGLLLSVAYTDQQQCSQMLDDIATATNSAVVWSSGKLNLIPYGDEQITGNGKTYVPPSAPSFDLTDDDFLPNQGSSATSAATTSDDPIIVDRKNPADRVNSVKVEFLNRTGSYNPEIVESKDQALIDTFGLKQSPASQGHMFALASAARLSAELARQRQAIRNIFTFTVDDRYACIDPMDIETLTDEVLGLDRQWVRVTEITENDDGSFTIVAEEYMQGTGAAASNSFQQGAGFNANTNVPPGDVNPPIFFEPTDELGGGLTIWMGLSGKTPSTWGGCQVWVSTDSENYDLQDKTNAPARMGSLTAQLATVAVSPTGQTIDTTHTLSVDISESGGTLDSGSQADALALNTLCYVDGEYIAYQTATLTGRGKYDLTYLVRGALGTEDEIGAHAAGSRFMRLDSGIFKLPFTQDRIGQTVYFKFPSFNIYGGALQSLADVPAYTYTITGSALASPLPPISNLRTAYLDNRTKLDWDEIADFRGVRYEIRVGSAWTTALSLGTVAHPPFSIPGDGTFWVSAVTNPVAGLFVYSETPESITVDGALINGNVLIVRDVAAAKWKGTFTGGAGIDQSINAIRTGGGADFVATPDVVAAADIIDAGGEVSGTFEIDQTLWIDAGYNTLLNLGVAFLAQGVPVGQDFTKITDLVSEPDITGSENTRFTDIAIDVAIAQDTAFDVFAPSDIFAEADAFRAGITWSPWQRFSPGVYPGRLAKFRVDLGTIDPATIAYMTQLLLTALIPARVDQYVNQTVPATGLAIAFTPTGSAVPRPFNGGPGTANLPSWNSGVAGGVAGDTVRVTGLTLTGCTVFIDNGGVAVTRSGVSLEFNGY